MSVKYEKYENPYPGIYTVHVDVHCANDREAVAMQQRVIDILAENGIVVSQHFLTDADDWAEHVHHDDHPDAVRVGIGRRIVIDEHGHRVP